MKVQGSRRRGRGQGPALPNGGLRGGLADCTGAGAVGVTSTATRLV